MDERAQGIILRIRPLTETSLIVRWLTRDQGILATVAKGARRPKSPFAGKIDLYFSAEFSFQRSRRSDLHTLRELALKNTHPALRREIAWLQQAAYAAALLETAVETETPLPELYDLFSVFLDQLPHRTTHPSTILEWEIQMLDASGLRPDFHQAPVSPASREILAAWLEAGGFTDGGPPPSPPQTQELQQYLRNQIEAGFGRVPRLRDAALAAGVGC